MIHTKQTVSPSSTLPLRGIQYMTSPSLPSAALQKDHLPQLPYNPIVCSDGDAFLAGTLREIGPSARLLLSNSHQRSVAAQDKGKFEKTKTKKRGAMHDTHSSRFVASNKTADAREKSTEASGKGDGVTTEVKLPSSPMGGSCTGHTSVAQRLKMNKSLPSKSVELSKTLNRTFSETRSNVTMSRTMPQQFVPPLASVLEDYVRREMNATLDAMDGYCTAMDRLRPFREAFMAFIEAFPGYSSILHDILTAYDGAVQEQSEMLTRIISTKTDQQFGEERLRTEVSHLNRTVAELTAELQEAMTALNQSESEDDHHPNHNTDSSAKRCPSSDGHRQRGKVSSGDKDNKIATALQKIKVLEEVNKSDLEKLLVLINAIRESDRRAKSLEHELAVVTAQVAELDDFKQMAGDAQMELEEFKLKYRSFVSLNDHELMKEHLTNELTSSQNLARHYRRAVAIRGTQVDVTSRKLLLLQEENERLMEAVENGNLVEDILTPRPNWKKVHDVLEEVKDNADPIRALPLDGDEGQVVSIEGLSNTSLQVDFLVERIQSLCRQLKDSPVKLSDVKGFSPPLIGFGLESNIPLHLRACGIIPRVRLDPVEMHIFAHDFFRDVLKPHPDVLLPTLDTSTLFVDFSRERISTREALKSFTCPQHLAMNIIEEAKDATRCRPAMLLLNGILAGVFPARIGCDAMTVLENVRSELTSLAAAQKKSRLRRSAISDCISPVLQLKSEEEIVALKTALGPETSQDVASLTATTSKFMSLLFDQECISGMSFYVNIVEKLTKYSYFLDQKNGGLVINLENVGKAIFEVEPLTPKLIVKEITEKSAEDSQDSTEEQIAHLGEVIRILSAAPVIRRGTNRKPEDGIL